MAEPIDHLAPIKNIQWVALLVSLTALAAALFYRPTFPVIGGLASGSIVSILNFRFLTRVIVKLTTAGGETSSAGKWGFFFFLKMTALIGVACLLILVVHVDPMAFVVGFSSIVVGIIWQGLRTFI